MTYVPCAYVWFDIFCAGGSLEVEASETMEIEDCSSLLMNHNTALRASCWPSKYIPGNMCANEDRPRSSVYLYLE
jgi:hypothetical protein